MIFNQFNLETKTLEVTYKGDISGSEIVDYIKATMNNLSLPRKLKILTNAKNAKMIFGPDDIPEIVEANNLSLTKFEQIKDAIIVKNPDETALTLFFKLLSENHKYRVNAFSTEQAAKKWLYHNNL